jgi:tetratricopeptide (TPR) repeat protein
VKGLRRRSVGAALLPRVAAGVVLLVVLLSLSASAPAVVAQRGEQGFSVVAPASAGVDGSAAASGVMSLAAIDGLVFSNQYEKAEQAYSAVLAARPGDAQAHAAHALFLAYAGELARALGEARAGAALAPSDGRAAAVLCRALDWNGSITEAVTAGRRAVSLAASDPLAQLFLSEALADSGDMHGSKLALDAASAMAPAGSSAYLRAEVHREAGNLAHDQGDALGQIDALYAAEREQPSWAERVIELAGALFNDADVDKAHTEFEKVLSLRGDDVSVLLSLGGSALLAADYQDAAVAYRRAGQLAPSDVNVLHGLAQIAMNVDGDADAAAAHLAAALRVQPGDYAAAAYLLYIARDVWRDEARGVAMIAEAVSGSAALGPSRHRMQAPDVDAVQAAHAQRALAVVNATRAAAGLPAVQLDDRLTASAVAHSFYWLFNQARASQKGLGIHGETAGTPGYVGTGVFDRDNAFGWRDGPVGEDITHRGTPEGAVHDWVDSVYHRFPILRPDLRVIGYADASMLTLPIEDMEFGFSGASPAHAAPVRYPADGQAGVPASFFDNELPDPVPAGAARVTGYPITVTFDRRSAVRMSSFSLSTAGGAPVALVAVQGPSDATENSAFLLPTAPLSAGVRYTAHIVAVVDGAAYDSTWSFTVAASH